MCTAKSLTLFLQFPSHEDDKFRRADLKGKIGFPYGRKHKKGKLSLPRCCSTNCRAAGSHKWAEAMKEAQPYFVANRGCTMVVALSSGIVDGPYLSSILQVCPSVLVLLQLENELQFQSKEEESQGNLEEFHA